MATELYPSVEKIMMVLAHNQKARVLTNQSERTRNTESSGFLSRLFGHEAPQQYEFEPPELEAFNDHTPLTVPYPYGRSR
jgi:hypothetical protein